MPTHNELDRLERMFGSQLGLNPYGESLYKWVRAGDMWRPFIITDGFGTAFENMAKEWKQERLLFTPEAKIRMMRNAEWLHPDQWVVARWFMTPAEQWRELFHDLLPWPHRGLWYAGNAALSPGELPSVANTDEVIGLIQKDRMRSFDDWMQQTEVALKLQERRNDSKIDAILRDTMTAFGSAKPGARGGHYTLPSRQSTERHDAVFTTTSGKETT